MAVLAKAGFKGEKGKNLIPMAIILAHTEHEIGQLFDTKKPSEFQKMIEALKNKSVAMVTTDFSGKGQFGQVKLGDYWIFGFTEIGKTGIVWNQRIAVKPGTNSVVLDNKSAAAVS